MKDINLFLNNIFKDGNNNLNLLGKISKIVVLFISIIIISKLINKLIDKTLKNKRISNNHISDKRANTLGEILKKILKNLLYFIGIVISLEMFNINTSSIIATAGIGGIAIGFGAQSLVKDLITGFFILMEDQFAVGDFVKIGDFEGIVEELGLRVTKLRDFSGELHIIPNGSIQIITNRTRGAMRALVKVSIAYEEDITKVLKALEDICNEIKETNKSIVEGPTVLGISNLGEYDVNVTVVAKTIPMEQWSVERDLRRRIKDKFESENIEIPYPKRVIYGGKER